MNIDKAISKKIPLYCLLKLQAIYDTLKSAEKRAADFILENPDYLADATIADAAKRAGCSEPTFVRLSRKIGLEGFAELKAELNRMKYMKNSPDREYSEFDGGDSPIDITRKVFTSSIQALSDTLTIVDEDQYRRATEALGRAGKLVFFGVGDASSVALSAMYKFSRIGYACSATSDPDHMLILASQLADGDAAVLISHSGRSRAIVNAAKELRRMNRTVIAITNFPISPLGKEADIVLLTSAFQEHVNGEVMAVRIVQLSIIESLFVCLLLKNPECVGNMTRSNDIVALNKID